MPQPHKGDRVAILSRPPKPVGDEIKRLAAASGVPVTDFVAYHLARIAGLPELVPPLKPVPSDSVRGVQGSFAIDRKDAALRQSA